MKKRVLFLATFLVATVVTLGTFYTNDSVKADSIKETSVTQNDEFINYKISVPSSYYSGKKISEMILHYGVNGWNDTKDVTMYVTTDDYHYGIPSSYVFNAIVKVRKGDTINYCFKTIRNDGTTSWNNNNGNDFSVIVSESNVKTISYEVDWLATNNNINGDVTLHYGINDWNSPTDIKMELKGQYNYEGVTKTWYKAIINVEEGATINYCVKSETTDGVVWDNNNGANYSIIAK